MHINSQNKIIRIIIQVFENGWKTTTSIWFESQQFNVNNLWIMLRFDRRRQTYKSRRMTWRFQEANIFLYKCEMSMWIKRLLLIALSWNRNIVTQTQQTHLDCGHNFILFFFSILQSSLIIVFFFNKMKTLLVLLSVVGLSFAVSCCWICDDSIFGCLFLCFSLVSYLFVHLVATSASVEWWRNCSNGN